MWNAKQTHTETHNDVVRTHLEGWGPSVLFVSRHVNWLEEGGYAPSSKEGKARLAEWWIVIVNLAKKVGAVRLVLDVPF